MCHSQLIYIIYESLYYYSFQINDISVVNATHERTVRLIKPSGDTLAMKVVTVEPLGHDGGIEVHADGTRTLPTKKKGKRIWL